MSKQPIAKCSDVRKVWVMIGGKDRTLTITLERIPTEKGYGDRHQVTLCEENSLCERGEVTITMAEFTEIVRVITGKSRTVASEKVFEDE